MKHSLHAICVGSFGVVSVLASRKATDSYLAICVQNGKILGHSSWNSRLFSSLGKRWYCSRSSTTPNIPWEADLSKPLPMSLIARVQSASIRLMPFLQECPISHSVSQNHELYPPSDRGHTIVLRQLRRRLEWSPSRGWSLCMCKPGHWKNTSNDMHQLC